MKSKKKLTAPQLRIVLGVTMVIIFVIGGVIFKFGHSKLSTVAHSVAETAAQADAGQANLNQLSVTKQMLKDNANVVQKASEMVAESKSYQYQNQIVTDLDRFAASAGISLTNITFDDQSSNGSPSTGSSAPTPAAAAPTPTTAPTGAAPSGAISPSVPTAPTLKTVSVTITFKNPVDYSNFLQFIHDIEQNLTKMQLKSLSLSQTTGGVSSESLTIEVYIK